MKNKLKALLYGIAGVIGVVIVLVAFTAFILLLQGLLNTILGNIQYIY